jgi:hypothetical protein
VFLLKNLWFFSSVEKSATLGYVVGVAFQGKLSLTFENLNLSVNKSKYLSLSDQSLHGKLWEVAAWGGGGGGGCRVTEGTQKPTGSILIIGG